MDLRILPLSSNQTKSLVEWFNEFVDEDLGVVENFHITEEQEKSYIQLVMKEIQKKKLFSYVAMLDKNIVGKVDIKPLTRYIDKHVVEISFGVLRKYSNVGITLLLYSEKIARENGFEVMIYYILSSNNLFISIFKKVGFQVVGCIKNFYKRDGYYYDRIILQKNIQ